MDWANVIVLLAAVIGVSTPLCWLAIWVVRTVNSLVEFFQTIGLDIKQLLLAYKHLSDSLSSILSDHERRLQEIEGK